MLSGSSTHVVARATSALIRFVCDPHADTLANELLFSTPICLSLSLFLELVTSAFLCSCLLFPLLPPCHKGFLAAVRATASLAPPTHNSLTTAGRPEPAQSSKPAILVGARRTGPPPPPAAAVRSWPARTPPPLVADTRAAPAHPRSPLLGAANPGPARPPPPPAVAARPGPAPAPWF